MPRCRSPRGAEVHRRVYGCGIRPLLLHVQYLERTRRVFGGPVRDARIQRKWHRHGFTVQSCRGGEEEAVRAAAAVRPGLEHPHERLLRSERRAGPDCHRRLARHSL